MAKKSARRNGGRTSKTSSQMKRQKRLQHFNFEAKLARRTTKIEGWNDKLTLTRNYKNLGIAFDANAIMAGPNRSFADPAHQLVPEKTGIMTDRLAYLQSLPAPAPHEVKSMNVQEQYQLQRLIQAHADDYEAMQMDLRLNVTQMTANKLQKRIELMFRLQQATNDSAPAHRGGFDDMDDEDFEDEDFDDEDFEGMEDGDEEEEEEEEEEEAVDADTLVPQVDVTGLSEFEAMRANRARRRMVVRINTINHNKEVNKKFKSGINKGSKIVVPALTQLTNTRGPKAKKD